MVELTPHISQRIIDLITYRLDLGLSRNMIIESSNFLQPLSPRLLCLLLFLGLDLTIFSIIEIVVLLSTFGLSLTLCLHLLIQHSLDLTLLRRFASQRLATRRRRLRRSRKRVILKSLNRIGLGLLAYLSL